jgi:murein DD-endopeptidase MepM/ murein hydrolase activator NlpD
MAIYESKGRRVQLEGTELKRGFNPQQVYDNSQRLGEAYREVAQTYRENNQVYLNQLQQVGKDLEIQNEQNLDALTGFSDTLSKFVIEKQTKYNETQKNLGIADILNGDLRLNQQLYQQYSDKKQVLETANDAQMQTVSEVRQVDPTVAESIYQQAPAVKGWRAYGQAIGKTQAAVSQAESFLDNFLKSDEPIEVPVNGKIERFTPRQTQTPEQLNAAWNVGMQKFIEASGLNQINPVILAEHASPVMMRVRAEILGQRMREIIKTREANEREDLRTSIFTASSLMTKDPVVAQTTISNLNKRLIELNDMDRKAGNDETHDVMKNVIRTLASKDLRGADALFTAYKGTLINPENPNLGTWGDRYEMTDISEFISQTGEAQQRELDKAAASEAEGIIKVFYAKPNAQTYNEAVDLLEKLKTKYPKQATEALSELTSKGPNWNPGREEDLLNTVKSAAELQALRAAGYISDAAYQRGTQKFAEAADFKKLLPSEATVDNQVRGKLRELLKGQVGSDEGFVQQSAFAVTGIRGLAMATVLQKISTGQISDPLQAQKVLDETIIQLIPEFFDTKKVGNVTVPTFYAAPKSNRITQSSMGTPNRLANGQTGLNLINTALTRVPAVTSSVKDLVLDPDRIQVTIDTMKSGGQAPSDVAFLAKTAGVSVPELLRRQTAQQSIPFDVNELGQGAATYQQNRSLSPRIAELLANPRIVGTQRRQLQVELNRLKTRREAPQLPAQELSVFGKQLSSVNYESPSGQPGVDLFFENKQFPVVLPGVVKDIRYGPGYGHYVVIESTDPETGEQVDVLYGHLASRTPLRLNQQVTAGQLVGTQGGTGNVRSADGTIASIDFLAPAPRGSGSMKAYRNFDKLRRRVVQSLGYK